MKKIILLILFTVSYSFAVTPSCVCDTGYWSSNTVVSYATDTLLWHKSSDPEIDFPETERYCVDNDTVQQYSYTSVITGRIDYNVNYYEYTLDKTITTTNFSCVAEPNCDDNQTHDGNGNCIDNPPEDNETTPPDSNSTKPDGSCYDDFAKDVNGDCFPDKDNDGIPEGDDSDDNDPNKGSSGATPESDCNGFLCGIENSVTKSPYGTPDNLRCVIYYIDCNTCFDTSLDIAGSCDGDGDGDDFLPPIDDTIPLPEDCNNPLPKLHGWKFQRYVNNSTICYDLRRSYALGGVTEGFGYSCPDDRVACYYNLKNNDSNSSSDNNSNGEGGEDSSAGETNSTSIDGNSSNNIDTKNIEDKLDITNDSLVDISRLISSTSSTNHTDLQNLNGTIGGLGNKLDGIKSAIQSQSGGTATDMTQTNQTLEDIKDKLNEGDGTESDSDNSGMQSSASSAVSSLSSSLSSIISSATGSAPIVSGTGQSSFSASIYGGTVTFDLTMFAEMSPFFDIVWILLLALINFKIYSIIIRDILRKL